MTQAGLKDPLLTGPQAAQRAGVTPGTWRGYVAKGYAPKADEPDEDTAPNRRNPKWKTSTVDRFIANRLGQGRRTDRLGSGV